MERGIVSDNNRHDALVYFGRRVSRKTFIENVRLWARVIKGMGLKEGDELLITGETTGAYEIVAHGLRNAKGIEKEAIHKGAYFSIKTDKLIHRGDKLYKMVESEEVKAKK